MEATLSCDDYELDIFSDEYIEVFIELKRKQYHNEYTEHYMQHESVIGG